MAAPDLLSLSARTILAALDAAPMGGRQYRFWLLASGGTLLDGFSIFSLGVALPLLTERFAVTPLMVGLIGSALVLGAALGAALGGPAADRFGRKPAFLADMAILVAGAALSAFAGSPPLVLLGQFLVGAGIGIDFPVSSSYVAETMPKSARSRMVVATIALQSVGMLLGAAAALGTLHHWTSATDWRLMVGASGVLGSLFLLFRLTLPESPRWLIEHGRAAEAARTVAAFVGQAPLAAGAQARAAPVPVAPAHPPVPSAGLTLLFSRPYLPRTLLAAVPWFLMDIATYGVGLFTPTILSAIHLSGMSFNQVARDFVDAEGSGAIDVFLLIGFAISLWAVPRFGRIRMQVLGFAGMTVGMLVLLAAASDGSGGATHIPLVFIGFILFNLAMNAGPNATTFTLAPELFPTAVRASASGFAAATAKVGATLGIFVLPQVRASWGVAGVLALMAAVSALGLATTVFFAREVRKNPGGVGLEDESGPK